MKSLFIFLFGALAQGLGPVALAAVLGTNVFVPGVPLSTNEMDFIRIAAGKSLAAFRSHITPANYRLMGFNSTNEVLIATNGEPLLSFPVQENQLTNYHSGHDFNFLLGLAPQSQPRAFVPIMVGTNVRSSTTLRFEKGPVGSPGQWAGDDWGHPKLIRSLLATYRAIPSGEIRPGSVPFVVEIPVPKIWLVGYYDIHKKLVFRSTVDIRLGPITINRNEVVTRPAMQQLATQARRYNPELPN